MNLMLSLLAGNYASWCLLALAQDKHHQNHFGHPGSPTRLRWLRLGGGLLAAMLLALALWRAGWAFGAVSWAVSWMAGAMLLVLLQPYRPVLARRLALPLLLLALLLQL